MKLISVITPCYNEEDNVEICYRRIKELFASLGNYRYEHLFIDNASTDRTQEILRRLAAEDKNVKVIINSRNYGHIRSPYYAMFQSRGDALVIVSADLQEPPALIPEFLKHWEQAHKIVLGVKVRSDEAPLMFALRKFYYRLVKRLSEVELINNFHKEGSLTAQYIKGAKEIAVPKTRRGGNGTPSENECAELVRLRRETAELAMERDVLSRSVALWVKERLQYGDDLKIVNTYEE